MVKGEEVRSIEKITRRVVEKFKPDCYGILSCIVEGGNVWYDVALGLSIVILLIGFVVALAKASIYFI